MDTASSRRQISGFHQKKRILSVIINLCALKQKVVRINLNDFIQRIRKQLR